MTRIDNIEPWIFDDLNAARHAAEVLSLGDDADGWTYKVVESDCGVGWVIEVRDEDDIFVAFIGEPA